MAEADRIAAALRYQQELDAAQRPATMNPNIAAQGLKSRNRIAAALASQPQSWSGEALPMEGRAAFLPFQDTMPDSVMNTRSLALPGIVAGAVNAITAPGRALVDPEFNQGEEAANVALNVMGGGMSASRGAPANALGMFVGPRSKSWNAEANARAVQMEKAGATPKTIWQETGNYKAPDAAWRQEINDAGSRMTEKVHSDIMSKHFYNDPLSEALTHESLYRAYPELGRINTTVTAMEQPKGSFSPLRNELEASGPSSMTQRSTALHEIQHAIQQKEGFARGGSPEMFRQSTDFSSKALQDAAILDKTMRASNLSQLEALKRFEVLFGRKPEAGAFAALERVGTGKELDIARDAAREAEKLAKNPLESYRRLAGEAEARATQKRRNLTDEQRRAEFPERSYDVPINELIIRR